VRTNAGCHFDRQVSLSPRPAPESNAFVDERIGRRSDRIRQPRRDGAHRAQAVSKGSAPDKSDLVKLPIRSRNCGRRGDFDLRGFPVCQKSEDNLVFSPREVNGYRRFLRAALDEAAFRWDNVNWRQ